MRQRSLFLLALSAWCVITTLVGIRFMQPHTAVADDDVVAAPASPAPTPSPVPTRHARTTVPSRLTTRRCHRTHGASARLTTDDRGYTCAVDIVDPVTNCCTEWAPRYACTDCTPTCCADYAQCTACCMGHEQSFARCSAACRTGSHSLDAHAGYAMPDTPYCWSTPPPPPPSPKPSAPATKILDLRE